MLWYGVGDAWSLHGYLVITLKMFGIEKKPNPVRDRERMCMSTFSFSHSVSRATWHYF